MEESGRKRHTGLMWALLLMILAVFYFLCEILSALLIQGLPREEVSRRDLYPEDYEESYVLPSWSLREAKHEDGTPVTTAQVRSYLYHRPLIMTTTQEDDWRELVQHGDMETRDTAVEPAIVQLKMSHQTGSGVILQITEEDFLISTCAHGVEDETEITVIFEDGTSAIGTVIDKSDAFDLAFLLVPSADIPYETRVKLRYAKVDESAWTDLDEDAYVFILASSRQPAGDYYEGYVQYKEIYVPEFDCYMLCIKSSPIPGMSGGGIFDMQGNLVAMVNGGTASGQVVGLSLPAMMGQLTNFTFGVK